MLGPSVTYSYLLTMMRRRNVLYMLTRRKIAGGGVLAPRLLPATGFLSAMDAKSLSSPSWPNFITERLEFSDLCR